MRWHPAKKISACNEKNNLQNEKTIYGMWGGEEMPALLLIRTGNKQHINSQKVFKMTTN